MEKESGTEKKMVHPGGLLGCASPFGPLQSNVIFPGACG